MQPQSIFSALADPTRFAVVEQLLREGEQPVGRLLESCAVSPPALSRHLKTLVDKGVLTRRVDAQQRIYAVRPEAIEVVAAWAISHREFWKGSLDRLEAALMMEAKRK